MAGGDPDDELIAILEEALERLLPVDSPLRARGVGRLADELSFSDRRDRCASLSEQAVAIARRSNDDRVLESDAKDAATLAGALRASSHEVQRGRSCSPGTALRETTTGTTFHFGMWLGRQQQQLLPLSEIVYICNVSSHPVDTGIRHQPARSHPRGPPVPGGYCPSERPSETVAGADRPCLQEIDVLGSKYVPHKGAVRSNVSKTGSSTVVCAAVPPSECMRSIVDLAAAG
jgi:hypothetical protein